MSDATTDKPTDKLELQNQISDADWKVAEAKANKKTAADMVADHVEAMTEYKEVAQLKEQLEKARERLNEAKLRDETLESLLETLTEKTNDFNYQKLILSGLCIQYVSLHRVRSVEISQENREIKMVATIGRKLKQQVELPL